MSNIIFPGDQGNTLLTPKKQTKIETKPSNTLIFSGNLKEVKEHTLITPSESDGLLFPGELQEEKSHTLISPITPQYNHNFLKADNALSEFDTEDLKAKARENLGVDDQIEWGEIQGSLEHQTDLHIYIKEKFEDFNVWIDVIN